MERFSSLKYKVHQATEPLDKSFPDLFRLPEFKKIKLRKEWERIVKYIVFLYDPGSDLQTEFQELKDRKEAAAIEAGYVREPSGKWSKELILIMQIKDDETHAAILAFLKKFKSDDWTNIVVTTQERDEFQELRFKAINDDTSDLYGDAKKKDGLMDSVDKRNTSLKLYKASFYGDSMELESPEFDEAMTPENSERIFAASPKPYEELNEEVDVQADTGRE